MIGALLNTVQTTLLGSRGFLFTSLLPVVLFCVGSYFLDTQLQPGNAVWAERMAAEKPGFTAICVGLSILVVAYMFSSINTLLRELLEGKLLRKFPGNPFVKYQMNVAELARTRFEEYQRSYWNLSRNDWVGVLRRAREEGSSKPVPQSIPQNLKDMLEALGAVKDALKPLDHDKLEAAAKLLKPLLEQSTANKKADPNSKTLSDLHVKLVQAIQYEIGRLQKGRTEAYWQSAAFPDDVAPTRLGNIAGTMRYYAESRYGILLDVFWTRLQKLIQADANASNALQDAKIQLDFFVSMVWLSALFSLLWSGILLGCSTRLDLFLLVSAGGFLSMLVCYQLACQSYLTFAEVVRSSVDLMRFQLIGAYHLPLPVGSAEERHLWETMASWIAYDSRQGDVLFEHKSP